MTLPLAFGFPISRISQSPWETIEIELSKLQIDGVDKVDLSRGTHLIVIMDTDCDHCKEALPELDALAEATDLPSLIALSMNDESARTKFVEEFQPAFPLGQIEEDVFWRLLGLGDVPRTILLKDMRVQRVWDHHVPDRKLIEAAM
jgi:thiol-disulfide isomerase/thioredoxin